MRATLPVRVRACSGPAIILCAALIASAALFGRGPSCGHDFDFHFVSWVDAFHSLRQGILYPRWAPSPNYGAGEPRFIFYPPLTWMAGAILRVLLPWKRISAVLTFLMFAAAGLSTRALARQLLHNAAATFAGCVAIFSGYTLFTAYERTAFGELTGSFWIPLLLLFLLRDLHPDARTLRRAFDGSAVLLTLVVAGAWLSDAPLGVIASYTVAALAVLASVLRRSWAPIVRSAVAATLGLGLAAIYIVPAAVEQPWVAIHQATDDPGYLIENNWFFARHAGADMRDHDAELFKVSMISLSMLIVACTSGVFVLRRSAPSQRRQWLIPLCAIPPAVLFLQLPLSHFVWDLLPKLRYLQFPWRWLVLLETPMAILFAAAIWPLRLHFRRMFVFAFAAAALLFSTASFYGLLFYQDCDEDDAPHGVISTYYAGDGFEGMDEYAPPGVDNSIAPLDLPMACLSPSPSTVLGVGSGGVPPAWAPDQHSCLATYDADQPARLASQHIRIHANPPIAGYLILRLRRYPAWQVRVRGVLQHHLPQREDGLYAVPVPAGPVTIALDWINTPDILIGRTLSAVSLLLFAGLWFIERRPAGPQVS